MCDNKFKAGTPEGQAFLDKISGQSPDATGLSEYQQCVHETIIGLSDATWCLQKTNKAVSDALAGLAETQVRMTRTDRWDKKMESHLSGKKGGTIENCIVDLMMLVDQINKSCENVISQTFICCPEAYRHARDRVEDLLHEVSDD